MLSLCIFITFVAAIQARAHGSFEIEIRCLEELNLTMVQVLPYVHKITDPEDKEGVGEFLACAWQGRNIINPNGQVSGRNVAQYLINIYSILNLTENQKNQIKEESKQCEKLKAKKLSSLGVKVKNCMLITLDNLGFLQYPEVKLL